MKVEVRLARPEELEMIRDIRVAAARELGSRHGKGHWSTEPALKTLRRHLEKDSLYVIEVGTEVAGTFKLDDRKIGFYRKAWFAEPDSPAAYLENMAIIPSLQRRGIGRLAMEAIERLVGSRGLAAIRLDAYVGAAGAGSFYRKCGYRLVHKGEIKGTTLEYFEKCVATS